MPKLGGVEGSVNNDRKTMRISKSENANTHTEGSDVPLEIDTHYQLFGKHAWEVEFGEPCAVCGKRVDEFGFCACGSAQ